MSRRTRLALALRRISPVVVLVSFVAGFWAAGYLIRLDRVVTARFEGTRFQVPSRVLSAPTVLYPGLDYQRIGLRETLVRLGYRERGRVPNLEPGQYSWSRDRLRVHLRAFEHPSRPEPARFLEMRLDGTSIASIRDLERGRPAGAVLVEPERVGAYYGPEREQRELVQLEDLPSHLIAAVISVEDQRFETHPGIDVRRIGGALVANLESGSIRQGGSTVTQQLVKNFFLTPERTLKRKVQEALMAILVELHYDKREILEAYLNEIYLGQRGSTAVHGMGEAARLYFGKAVRNLSLAESALLAAIIQSPNAISPYRNPERAIERRNLVLSLMRGQGRIDEQQYQRASAEPIHVSEVTPDPREGRYFLDAVRRQLPEHYGADVLENEGLEIYSTLDLRLQRSAARALREGLENLEKWHPRLQREDPTQRLQACLVAIRPQTGEVLALVGGRDYGASQFDRCTQARRPAGSIFKPFVYIAALEPGRKGPAITLASFLSDEPLEVKTPSGPWRPANYDGEFHGSVNVRTALERSLNVATARLGQEIGVRRVLEVARRLGVESPLPAVPSLALGAADVSPIEIARAYATIANGGIRPQLRNFEDVLDAEGNTLERRALEFERVLDPGTAYLAVSLLEGVVERGTGAGLRAGGLQGPIAGKTGTSDDERDAWFVAFTPELVVAVWVGFDEPESLGLSGSSAALPIWANFLRDATGGRIRGAFLPPGEIVRAEIAPSSGALALDGCPEGREEIFLPGTLPSTTCPENGYVRSADESEEGGFLEWLRKSWLGEGV